MRRTQIRLKNDPVLERFSINIYRSLIRKRDISFCDVGYFPGFTKSCGYDSPRQCGGDQKDASLLPVYQGLTYELPDLTHLGPSSSSKW